MTNKKPDIPLTIEEKRPVVLSWAVDSGLALLLSELPSGPGVYSFEDGAHRPIYIGKTIHPATRVRQHIKTAKDGVLSKEHFVFRAKYLKVIPVNSELEAILLEARLIKIHRPRFNLIQKDDKSELYISIGGEEFPEIRVIRGTDLNKKLYWAGPFTSMRQVQLIMRTARRIFRFCATPNKKGGRACFYYHLGLCDGACVGSVSGSVYRRKIGLIKRFLNGQTKELLRQLKREIAAASKEREYEKAKQKAEMYLAIYQATYISQGLSSYLAESGGSDLRALGEALASVGVEANLERIEAYDVATLSQRDTVGSMVVFYLGNPQKDQYRRFKMRSEEGGDVGAMAEMIRRRFARDGWQRPGLVILDGGIPQLSVAGREIPAEIPRIGLAKKEETIIVPGKGEYKWVSLPRSSPALQLLQQIRDEAHRFATTYHKLVRGRRRMG